MLAGLASPVAMAHPHVFVTTRMVLDLDPAQQVTGVTMTWEYDDFFSLSIFEDMGLDADADGVLTEGELDRLMGFDLVEWPPGFEGDLYVYAVEQQIEMPRPVPHDIAVRDGKIVATQKRSIPPVAAEGLVIQQYDPTYYVAYDLSGGVEVPAPCAVKIEAADFDAAEAEIARLAEEQNAEDIYMDVSLGHLYASRIVLSCGG
jgi:ABC-type uncharacterized transport system substrate-binding protein